MALSEALSAGMGDIEVVSELARRALPVSENPQRNLELLTDAEAQERATRGRNNRRKCDITDVSWHDRHAPAAPGKQPTTRQHPEWLRESAELPADTPCTSFVVHPAPQPLHGIIPRIISKTDFRVHQKEWAFELRREQVYQGLTEHEFEEQRGKGGLQWLSTSRGASCRAERSRISSLNEEPLGLLGLLGAGAFDRSEWPRIWRKHGPKLHDEEGTLSLETLQELRTSLRCAAYSGARGVDCRYLFRWLGQRDQVNLEQFLQAIRRAKLPMERASDAQLGLIFQLLDPQDTGWVHVQHVQAFIGDKEPQSAESPRGSPPSTPLLKPSLSRSASPNHSPPRSPSLLPMRSSKQQRRAADTQRQSRAGSPRAESPGRPPLPAQFPTRAVGVAQIKKAPSVVTKDTPQRPGKQRSSSPRAALSPKSGKMFAGELGLPEPPTIAQVQLGRSKKNSSKGSTSRKKFSVSLTSS